MALLSTEVHPIKTRREEFKKEIEEQEEQGDKLDKLSQPQL